MAKYRRRRQSAGHTPAALHAAHRLARSGSRAHSCKYLTQFINRWPVWPHAKHGFHPAAAVAGWNSGALGGAIGWKPGPADLASSGGGPAHSSCGPAAISPDVGPRSSVDALHGLGVPGALDPVPEHPQKRTGSSGRAVALERVGRTSSAEPADLEIPLVDGQELAVSRPPHGIARRGC